ncbi:hypothetical protein [Mycobacterium sp. C31M]
MGQFIMLGTLFGLIALIFGLVISFDPEARGDRPATDQSTGTGTGADL